ncbi:hypothetical protein [Lampropedia aestuarii]|uniref:hypothetical protein n=1 Tax=Lampropedia aestuarii TaxID=2562762 RepID=UPI0024684C16|nr:hypothetical protein [Lampropedia aestuarii]MDH5857010.1 hypothetical protein [Lampropedia aestuarii]
MSNKLWACNNKGVPISKADKLRRSVLWIGKRINQKEENIPGWALGKLGETHTLRPQQAGVLSLPSPWRPSPSGADKHKNMDVLLKKSVDASRIAPSAFLLDCCTRCGLPHGEIA